MRRSGRPITAQAAGDPHFGKPLMFFLDSVLYENLIGISTDMAVLYTKVFGNWLCLLNSS
jgi:hypothetical protein